MKGYTTRDVARMLDLPEAQVRSFARAGFLDPHRGARGEFHFSFQDLILLRTAKGLTEAHVPAARLQRALRKLKEQLPAGRPLSSLQIQARGEQVVVRREGELWNPESGQAHFDFEVAELAQKAAPLARQAVEQARASADEISAEGWYELAFELEATDVEQAMKAYREAIEREPQHVAARVNYGRLLLVTGQLNTAETQFRLALARGPNGTVLFNLGVVLEDLGRLDEAIQAYGEAIAADPECADAYFNLSRLLEKTGDSREALRYLSTYRKLTDH